MRIKKHNPSTLVPDNQLSFRLPAAGPRLAGELIIDSFAGAGGVSLAIENVFGRSPDIAINHNKIALDTHKLNHPATHHVRENIWKVEPRKVTKGRPVGLFWASPDCTHFSKAKGGKPVKQRRRGLANVIIKWARDTQPRVIGLENVEEFQTWGPVILQRDEHGQPVLDDDGKRQWVPDKKRAGEYFRAWKASLGRMGYVIDHRMVNAADYGAPTTRIRFFMIARRDGQPICWPEPTHGEGRPSPWVPAADIIDFSLECPSIFDRKKPLAEATLRRIAMGVVRYVLEDQHRFIVQVNHGGKGFRGQGLGQPMPTISTKHGFGVVTPTIMTNYSGHRGRKLGEPIPAQTTRPHHNYVAPSLVPIGYGERKGQRPRTHSIRKPLPTAVGANKFAKAYALLKHYTGVVGQPLRRPASTVTAVDHHALEAVCLTKFHGTAVGSGARQPSPTILAGGGHLGMVAAFLVKYYGTAIGAHLRYPADTVTTKPRFAVVVVQIDGQDYYIADIGMRMLQPHELAAAHDFPPGYFLLGTKEQQVAMIGNSVPWKPAAALLRANFFQESAIFEEAVA